MKKKEAFKLLLIDLTILILVFGSLALFTIGLCIKNAILTIVGVNGLVLMIIVLHTLINMEKRGK